MGQPPEDVTELFLRQSTVLLKPGEGQYDVGVAYVYDDLRLPTILADNSLSVETLRQRRLIVPLSVRFGLRDRLEAFAQIPVGLSHFEQANADVDENSLRVGVGDFAGGLKWLIRKEEGECPDVIGAFSFSAPTGADPFSGNAAMGSGFWSISGDLNFIKSYDPIVVFSGFGYTHEFGEEFGGIEIQPGETFRYSLGLGFAVNDYLILSTQFDGQFQTYTYVLDQRVPNSWQEPMTLRFAMTRVICRDRFVEPFVAFGLTPDAPRVNIGISWTQGFGRCTTEQN